MKGKKMKIDTFLKVHNFSSHNAGDAKWYVFIPNGAFWVAKSALGPHGANPPHIYMTQGKIGQFFKIRVFLES